MRTLHFNRVTGGFQPSLMFEGAGLHYPAQNLRTDHRSTRGHLEAGKEYTSCEQAWSQRQLLAISHKSKTKCLLGSSVSQPKLGYP